MSPWDVELHLTRDVRDRRALAKDAEKDLVRSVRHGVYVATADVVAMTVEEKHVVAVRALAAVSDRPLVLSHWSAAVLHGLDVLGERLGAVDVTFEDAGARGLQKVRSHLFGVREEELVELHGLLVTAPGRTVVDIAGSGTFEDGVVVADAALRAGIPREMLELAVDLAGPRRSAKQIAKVMELADGDSDSAGESVSRARRSATRPMPAPRARGAR